MYYHLSTLIINFYRVTYYAEFLPRKARGVCITILEVRAPVHVYTMVTRPPDSEGAARERGVVFNVHVHVHVCCTDACVFTCYTVGLVLIASIY